MNVDDHEQAALAKFHASSKQIMEKMSRWGAPTPAMMLAIEKLHAAMSVDPLEERARALLSLARQLRRQPECSELVGTFGAILEIFQASHQLVVDLLSVPDVLQ